ncbi:MAG: hypothetical protein EA001_07855 [Oscillatoriales cyanobacterium]|nr:MAG: hypothetical protein EA001_07855 [Oscillatoriales cyanobacterium]
MGWGFVTDPIDRLEKELIDLRKQSKLLAEQLYQADRDYLSALGAAARQQLILATYRICTQKYPQQFLGLSFADRQQLQEALRRVARDLAAQLEKNLLLPVPAPSKRKLRLVETSASGSVASNHDDSEADRADDGTPSAAEMAAALAAAFNSLVHIESIELPDLAASAKPDITAFEDDDGEDEDEDEDDDLDEDDLDDEDDDLDDEDDDLDDRPSAESRPDDGDPSDRPDAEEPDPLAAIDDATAAALLASGALPDPLLKGADNPSQVLLWQRSREKLTTATLRAQSHRVNDLLRSAGILPGKLPAAVLEIATKADLSDATSQAPNLIDLAIDGPLDDDSSKGAARFVVVHLRLAEIQFNDPILQQRLGPIRRLLDQLDQLRARYEKLQQQQAIAAAESAWRSAWFED